MTFKEIQQCIEKVVCKKRMEHILGVVEAAESLALQYGENVEKARLAALLHDCCKDYSTQKQAELAEEDMRCTHSIDEELFLYPALLHGPAGAVEAKTRYGILDETILETVRIHTTGKVNMSTLDKIVFVADYIEKHREYPGVEQLRKLAFSDLDAAVLEGYNNTIAYLLRSDLPIYSQMMHGRNDALRIVKEKRRTHEKRPTSRI